MGVTLDKVVPWGRSYAEYVRMFDLSDADLQLRILGCGDGPASFNAELTQRGGHIVSLDPIYEFNATQIKSRITETCDVVLAQMHKNQSDYVWDAISSVEELGRTRMLTMENFLLDYDAGKSECRYIAGELPTLPFKTSAFDIALSSHFLFLYSAHFPEEFHLQALREMLRVSREVRVFPLLMLDGNPSPYINPIAEQLVHQGFNIERRRVPYEFQRSGNEMLLVKPA